MIGAMLGSLFVWLAYKDHYTATDDTGAKLATFCTAPAIRKPINNFITEMVGTFVFVLVVFFIIAPQSSLGALDALPVAFIVFAIGLSLGGPTGYAINPVRDFGPRLMHSILPIGKKGSSDWAYSWVPILGPIVGALLAAMVYKQLM